MGSGNTHSILSARRVVVLLSALLVALGSGTNYVYSAYAPQLAAALRISHTQLNVIGLAGNVGVYSTGPLSGRLVDSRGPKLLFVVAFVFLFTGYSGIRYFYDQATKGDDAGHFNMADQRISTIGFCILIFCSFLTGAGGNSGLTSAMNATAKSFADEARATTTGIVISGFGLSAFFFSAMAHLFFSGDTSSLLLLLAIGTSLPMILGFFCVSPVPIRSSEEITPPAHRPRRPSRESHTPLLATPSEFFHASQENLVQNTVDMNTSATERRHRSSSRRSGTRSVSRVIEVVKESYGKDLLAGGDFWLLFSVLVLLSGTGIMYINNVGSITQALFAHRDPHYDEGEAARWQGAQVSTISIMNCLGRVLSGLMADMVKTRLLRPRSYCLVLVSSIFILSQVVAAHVNEPEHLWQASTLLGLAYGMVFGLMPVLVIEWFGLIHFSENWGYIALAPMVGGNLFSLAFGRDFDAHAEEEKANSLLADLRQRAGSASSSQLCLQGRDCYTSTLRLTIAACSLALLLSIYAGYKDQIRMKFEPVDSLPGNDDVIWEEEEET